MVFRYVETVTLSSTAKPRINKGEIKVWCLDMLKPQRYHDRGSKAQWVADLTRKWWMTVSHKF